ncbi:NADH-quinone oxidoreductase subunit NuoF [soil metagenome]
MPASLHALLPDAAVVDLAAYTDAGGGRGLERALEIGPDATIEEVRRSGLRGRGGAGFPTGTKWSSVAEAAQEGGTTYVACNAAEGEPGTFKDRALMARNPYRLVEGVLIAKHAVGAPRAFIAVKERFTHERQRVVDARDAAVAAGWEGADELKVVFGPDEYLFGEESAMLEVIEGKLPLPRIMPPYQAGLFATMGSPNPTVVNNVETLSNVPSILAEGAEAFRAVGTEEAPGTMVFTVVGDVETPGVYELPLGTSLRTLVCEIAGAEDPQAIISGVSNTVITPDLLDLPLDFDSFAEAGSGMGSGGFMVYGAQRDMVQVAATLARFLAIESCGQCLACKLGTGAMWEHLDRLVAGDGDDTDIQELRNHTQTVTDGNRCYLPVGAALLIRSFLIEFGDAFTARIGSPSAAEPVPVPKLLDVDPVTGEVTYDPEYHRKRADWSYAETDGG